MFQYHYQAMPFLLTIKHADQSVSHTYPVRRRRRNTPIDKCTQGPDVLLYFKYRAGAKVLHKGGSGCRQSGVAKAIDPAVRAGIATVIICIAESAPDPRSLRPSPSVRWSRTTSGCREGQLQRRGSVGPHDLVA